MTVEPCINSFMLFWAHDFGKERIQDDDSCIKNLEHTFEGLESTDQLWALWEHGGEPCDDPWDGLDEHPMTGVDEGLAEISHPNDGAKGHADFVPPSGDQDDTLVDTQVDYDATDARGFGDDGLPADLQPDAPATPGVFGGGILPENAQDCQGLEKDELKAEPEDHECDPGEEAVLPGDPCECAVPCEEPGDLCCDGSKDALGDEVVTLCENGGHHDDLIMIDENITTEGVGLAEPPGNAAPEGKGNLSEVQPEKLLKATPKYKPEKQKQPKKLGTEACERGRPKGRASPKRKSTKGQRSSKNCPETHQGKNQKKSGTKTTKRKNQPNEKKVRSPKCQGDDSKKAKKPGRPAAKAKAAEEKTTSKRSRSTRDDVPPTSKKNKDTKDETLAKMHSAASLYD